VNACWKLVSEGATGADRIISPDVPLSGRDPVVTLMFAL